MPGPQSTGSVVQITIKWKWHWSNSSSNNNNRFPPMPETDFCRMPPKWVFQQWPLGLAHFHEESFPPRQLTSHLFIFSQPAFRLLTTINPSHSR